MGEQKEHFQSQLVRSSLEESKSDGQIYALAKMITRQRQEDQQMALANFRLSSLNLFLGVSNYSRNLHMAKEQALLKEQLNEGRKIVAKLEGGMLKHDSQIAAAESKIGANKAKVEELESHLKEIVDRYDTELANQRKLLQNQRQELLRMSLSLFKQDLTVDSSILLLAWIIVNTPIIDWPLRMLSITTSALPLLPIRRSGRNIIFAKLARILLLLFITRTLRIGAMRRGWHNCVGTPEAYVSHVGNLVQHFAKAGLLNKQAKDVAESKLIPSSEESSVSMQAKNVDATEETSVEG